MRALTYFGSSAPSSSLRLRLELVRREVALGGLLLALLDHQRRDPLGHRVLAEHRLELGVDDVDLVHADRRRRASVAVLVGVVGPGQERLHQGGADLAGVGERRLLGEPGPLLGDLAVAEAVVRRALAPDDVPDRLLALLAQQRLQPVGRAQRVGAVRPGQPAVAGDDQDRGPARVLPLGQQRVVGVGVGRERDSARVSSLVYGSEASTRCCALAMRDVATSSIALVICLVWVTARIRRRRTRRVPAMASVPVPGGCGWR